MKILVSYKSPDAIFHAATHEMRDWRGSPREHIDIKGQIMEDLFQILGSHSEITVEVDTEKKTVTFVKP